MNLRASREKGFSLVELLVTALIFGIGMLGLAALQVSTLRSNTGGRNRFTATSLAEGCMSAIQAEGAMSWAYATGIQGGGAPYPLTRIYTGTSPTTGTFGTFDVNGQPVAAGSPTAVFTVKWTQNAQSSQVPSAAITGVNLREFVVKVTWQDQLTSASGTTLAASSMSMSRLIRY
jgi:prepilin-type N-terminal cleavage/methylation domain-containing protein